MIPQTTPTRSMARRWWPAVWFGGLLLVGCAPLTPWYAPPPVVGPAPEVVRPLDVTPRTEPPPDGTEAEGAEPPPCISVANAVTEAVRNNPRLLVAAAAVEQARGRERAAFAPFLPQFDLLTRGGATAPTLGPGAPGPTGGIVGIGDGGFSFAQAELQLQWTVFDFGRTAGRHQQAIAQERIAGLRLERARQTTAFDAVSACLQAMLAGAEIRTQRDAVRRAEAMLEDVKARRAAGVAERDDVLRGEVLLSEAREAIVRAEEAEAEAVAKVNNVLGRNAALPLRVAELETEPALVLTLPQCLEVAIVERREIAAARQTVAAAQAGRQTAEADFWPAVYLRGSLGRVEGDDVRSGWQEGTAIHIDTPLYRGGARQGNLQTAAGGLAEAVASARVVLDSVTLEVTLAYRAATAARKRIELSQPAVAEARENLRLVRQRYRNGNATPTDIVDAETALTRAQQRVAASRYEYLAALARLDYAMGRPQDCLLANGALTSPKR